MQTAAFNAKQILRSLTTQPGVYRMLNAKGEVLYIGKARNLKNRVSSYFNKSAKTAKTQALVNSIQGLEVSVTHSETEALILESQLVKQLKPPYNILLRDDKSFPYIHVSIDHAFPRLSSHRGAKRGKGLYLGPYPSALAVRESLTLLQKLFKVRQCEDSFFRNRSRPCLQYQIKRCSGPCVAMISNSEYQQSVRHTLMVLEGKDKQVMNELVSSMDQAAQQLNFEVAGKYRDLIVSLRKVQEKQYVSGERGDVDAIAITEKYGCQCVNAISIRGGRVLGDKAYYPKLPQKTPLDETLAAFLSQYYLTGKRVIPQQILLNHKLSEGECLQQALSYTAGRKVQLALPQRGERQQWLSMATLGAEQALVTHLAARQNIQQRFLSLKNTFNLEQIPNRLECFDISHLSGQHTVASCVVFDRDGPKKSDYRRFNINNIQAGDDYAAMKQALSRRYRRVKADGGVLPDILFIDGGKGQLTQAQAVMQELDINQILLVGIAKGSARKPGLEELLLPGQKHAQVLAAESPALHIIQHIRDESHRFAITGHRQLRKKAKQRSILEEIPQIGAARRKALLRHFGGLQQLKGASLKAIAQTPSISKTVANEIYQHLHS